MIEASQPSRRASPVARLIAPVRGVLLLACFLQAMSATAGVVPFIAVAELGRVLLTEEPIDTHRAWLIAGAGVGALLMRFLFLMTASGLTHLADIDLQLDLRQRIAARLGLVPLGWFTARSTGHIKKMLQDDVAALHQLVGHAYTNMVTAVVTPIFALAYLIWVDWRLAIAAAGPSVLGVALYSLQYRGYGEKMTAYNQALDDVNAASGEFVQGIAVVKTFGQARRAYGRFVERTRAFIRYFWDWVSGLLRLSAVTEVVLSPLFCLSFVLVVGLILTTADAIAPIDLVPAAILAPGLAAPFLALAFAQNELMLAKQAAVRIIELMDAPTLSGSTRVSSPQGSRVEFTSVNFSYDGEVQALADIDLVLEPGTVTALVGPSGSGKSTLARLLPRFWDPTTGSIRIGGAPLVEVSPDRLYQTVSFVFQDVQLLHATIRENIALARPEASLEEIERVARAAQIHERILALPRGYESVVGEDAQLSGGEAQRVSIARATLADTPILVLDEATAFADPDSEAAIQDALSTLVAGRTLLVIAHRLQTVAAADLICVLDNGRIVERGRHRALLQNGGLYAHLWEASEKALNRREGLST